MANTNGKNNLSGAIGNIVFVNDGKRSYVRSRPAKVKQTEATRAESAVFGMVSEREKWLRFQILSDLNCPSVQYFAARHRARLRKLIVMPEEKNTAEKPYFGNPETLAGFDFNPKMEWTTCTNFCIGTKSDNENTTISIPELRWGREIKAVAGAKESSLDICIFSVNLNAEQPNFSTLEKISAKISANQPLKAQSLSLPHSENGNWRLVAACLKYDRPQKKPNENFAACYLWAEK